MSLQDTNFHKNILLKANGKKLNLKHACVMGIVNLTPDSFYVKSRLNTQKKLLKGVEKQIKEGAAIIDVGAMSSRPGAKEINEKEELKRLLPSLQLIRSTFPDVFISVDTYRAEIARLAAEEGVDMVNDISAGEMDKNMMKLVAKSKLPYVMMHMQGTPLSMQENPKYKNVVNEVKLFLEKKIIQAKEAGIKQLIIDPGFGFGKTLEHNYKLLHHLNDLNTLGYPLLVGFSRKSMINKVLNNKATEALNGTTVLNTIALLKGAKILRVHDVKEAVEAVRIVESLEFRDFVVGSR